MGTSAMSLTLLKSLWENLDRLDVTPTEVLILFALACSANEVAGCCHPKMAKIVAKTHLALPTVKKSTRSLKKKRLVTWLTKPRHVNEYRLDFASDCQQAVGGAAERGKVNAQPPTGNPDNTAEALRKAGVLLAYCFSRFLSDPGQRALATVDFGKAIAQRGFLPCFNQFFSLKARAKGLSDGEIYDLVLRNLTAPTSTPTDQDHE